MKTNNKSEILWPDGQHMAGLSFLKRKKKTKNTNRNKNNNKKFLLKRK